MWFVVVAMLAAGTWAGAAETPMPTVRPPILSASETAYPPFCIMEGEGRAGGFSVELMQAALGAMGRQVSFRTGSWADVKGWLETGDVQALPLVGRTPERESVFDFTFPYISLHGAIVVRKGTTTIQTMADLRNRQVAVMKGDNAEEFLRQKDRGIQIHTTETFEDALVELSQGRYDAVVIQRLVAFRLLQQTNIQNLMVIHQPTEGFRQDFCFAVQEGDRETLALLNEGLALVMADGTFRRLYAKWFASLELPSNRRIVVGGDYNYPPYEFLDEKGLPAGYNVDLTRAIAQELGLDIEIRLGPWPEITTALARKEIHAIQGMLYSPERDLIFDFTPPHIVNHYVSVVPKGHGLPPANVAELAGKAIVVQDGDIMHDFMVKQGLMHQVSTVNSQEEALKELSQGKHETALVARLTALHWIKQNRPNNLVVGKHPFVSPEYCYAVSKNQKDLLAQFSEGLRLIEASGEYRRIYEKWMGIYEDSSTEFMLFLRYVGFILTPLFLLLLVFFLWSWSLRKQVARQTQDLQASEKELLESNTRLAQAIQGNPIPTFMIDRLHTITHWNRACENLTGFSEAEMKGTQKHWQAFYSESRPILADFIVEGATAEEIQGHYEHKIQPSLLIEGALEGEHFFPQLGKRGKWLYFTSAPLRDQDGKIFGAIETVQDISDRKSTEDQLRQAQKMESVGRLAGGVAHDYNNSLSVIMGFAELAMVDMDPADPLHGDLKEILKAAKRAADITRQLLAFARKQTIAPKVLDLNENVGNMLKMLGRLMGEDIDLSWLPGKTPGNIKMDPSQLDQILANLCINARDAIAGVGKVTIETGTVVFDAAYCADHKGFVPGDFIMLAFSDTGCGMDKDLLTHIFEPFFTTKAVDKGTGLGLSTVYGIVKQNNGFINVYSEPGKGTTFRIYLPEHQADAVRMPEENAREILPASTETILLVEDDLSILKLVEKLLQGLGYTVLAASSTTQAIGLGEKESGKIHLLVTDVIMPEMNGRELADQLKSLYPDLKCLFMSGYTANAIAHHGVLDQGVYFIQKPFSKKNLESAVRKALDG